MDLGIIGLGKMGSNIALQCVEKGINVVGMDRMPKPELAGKGIKVVSTYEEFTNSLNLPRIIFLLLPAGLVVDEVITKLERFLTIGDVIIDGGNSYYKDSVTREKLLSQKGFLFVDCGVSGGIEGARQGACFMVGGKPEATSLCEPILKALAVEGGYLYCGGPGSGHFVKLVHNGIEFGMLQAIGEGVELLESSDYSIDLKAVFHLWSNGSVIRSWLVELMERGLNEVVDLRKIPDFVEDTGEVNWLIEEAIQKEIPLPVITQSVMELFRSRRKENDSARAIAIMRHGFGSHPVGKNKQVEKERKTGRIHPT